MENASKALLIAGGVLIAILIITLMIHMFISTGKVSKTYNTQIKQEDITTFNSNFTKYLGQDLTIHEVVTICNFAQNNNVNKVEVPSEYNTSEKLTGKLSSDLSKIEFNEGKRYQNTYKIKIEEYDNGFISKISFIGPVLKEI